MIKLHSDCLVFETAQGEQIPCSAESVSVEMLGDACAVIDPEVVRAAAAAVLHYFRHELGRESVTVAEFVAALKTALDGLGFSLTENPAKNSAPANVAETDLCGLVSDSDKAFELAFFPRLREVLGEQLNASPALLRFTGLRPCVKQLAGAQRWCQRCEKLSDQIVSYLRECLSTRTPATHCALVVV
jgi:hypothetical protein